MYPAYRGPQHQCTGCRGRRVGRQTDIQSGPGWLGAQTGLRSIHEADQSAQAIQDCSRLELLNGTPNERRRPRDVPSSGKDVGRLQRH